jgi:hypothetical protein
MEFAPTELLTLAILIAGAPFLVAAVKASPLPGARWFGLSYAALLLSNVCTIAEAWAAYTLFNAVEHIATAVFALLFFVACRAFLLEPGTHDERVG